MLATKRNFNMPKIIFNAIVYADHTVLCDPKIADAASMLEMANTLAACGNALDHRYELAMHNNDGSWVVIDTENYVWLYTNEFEWVMAHEPD
jgi:hypothetical protein